MHTSFEDNEILGKFTDDGYINKFPDDAAEIAELVRSVDLETAIQLLQVWGSKQRDIGAIKALDMAKEAVRDA